MPSVSVKPDDRSPASAIFLNGSAVKRKCDEEMTEESSCVDRELSREEWTSDAKRHCSWSEQQFSGTTAFAGFENYGAVRSSPFNHQLAQQQLSVGIQVQSDDVANTVVQSDENYNGGVESLEMDMDVDCGASGASHAETPVTTATQTADNTKCSQGYSSCAIERTPRSTSAPRCFCRLSWDPMLDTMPYISDIY